LLTNILIAKNMQKWVFVSVMMGLAVNLVLNWLLIPRIGFAQAGMNLLISEVIILASEIYYIRR
jgi:O-antigen/teichoic acid export membrane protein